MDYLLDHAPEFVWYFLSQRRTKQTILHNYVKIVKEIL